MHRCPFDVRIVLQDHARLPGRFFGRMTAASWRAFDALPRRLRAPEFSRSFPASFKDTRFTDMKPRTLYDKIWDDHLVDEQPDGTCLLYIDRHLVHEVTSPQAFEGLRLSGRKVRAPEKTLAVVDHNVPTTDRSKPHRRSGKRGADRRPRRERQASSASNITTSSTSGRASSTSSGRSRASPCPARPSSAATATPRPMAPSARSPMASAPRRSSMCWRPRR